MGKTHSKSRNYWMKRDVIIQISNYTCFKDDSYEWGTNQKVYSNSSSRCIKRFHRTVLLRSKKIRNDKSKSFYQIFFSFSILRNKM